MLLDFYLCSIHAQDMDNVDKQLVKALIDAINFLLIAVAGLVFAVVIIPWILISFIPVSVGFVLTIRYYIRAR